MKRPRRSLVVAMVMIPVGALACILTGDLGPSPSRLRAAALTPAPTPADDRQVAVLTLKVTSNEAGEVTGAVMVGGFVQAGFGPNVLNRPGAWTVSLGSTGEEVLRYGVPDPRLVRVEGGVGEEPHTSFVEPEVEFDLIVPLSDASGNALSVTELRLLDQAGSLIFTAGLREGKLFPIPLRQPLGAAG